MMTQTETRPQKRKNKKLRITLISIAAVIALSVIGCAVYVNDYYHTDEEAAAAFTPIHAESNYDVTVTENDTIIYEPSDADTAFIFYPGGKVEYTAYGPLMDACAAEGIMCVLMKMPFNLAVLDVKAADGIREQFPEIEHWYIGGHSLGGSMAAAYLEDSHDTFDGLILLGSYSTADLSQTGLDVLSVYGTEDNVLDSGKYNNNKKNLPDDLTEVIIEGGCHAYFGVYGPQEGDGTPSISNEEQIRQTADAISDMIR